MVIHVARKIGNLLEKVFFLGGSATGLLVSDPAMPDVRITQDVDVIVEAVTWKEYHHPEEDFCKRVDLMRKLKTYQAVRRFPKGAGICACGSQ